MIAAATPHSVTCPQAVRTQNNRAGLRSIWHSPEWIQASTAYRARHFPVCSRCGRVGPIVPGHAPEDYYPGMEEAYIQKVRDDRCAPICPRCNAYEAKGRHPCPSCIEKHREDFDHPIRYINQDQEICYPCAHPGTTRKQKRRSRSKFPCGNRTGQQRCQRNGRLYVCGYSSAKAPECDHFCEKKAGCC